MSARKPPPKTAQDGARRVPQAGDEAERLLHELQVHQVELIQQNEELRQARAEIEAGLARYTDLYEFAPVAYFTLAPNGAILSANLTGAQLLGVPRSRLIGRRLQSFAPPGGADELDGLFTALSWGDPTVRREAELVADDGTRLTGSCVGSLDPALGTYRVAILDLTAQRRAEAALRVADRLLGESQRLEALGRLAGGVAHDFNNILMAINGTAELLEESLGEDDPRRADARSIRESGDHAAALARQLLAFGRRQTLRPAAVGVEEAMRPIVPLLHRTLGEDITVVLDFGADLGPISVDPVQFEQVIVNLAFNARDAMPHGGTLTISSALAMASDATARDNPSVRPGPFAQISVTDTGSGIPADVLAHLFEPFFTTKEMGHGTGLGLATVDGIVAQSGGWIEVTSVMGQGTAFSVFLPLTTAPPVAASEPAPEVAAGGTETILYVEDDAAVRLIGVRMLRTLGYSVIDIARPELARALDADVLATVSLLVTDVIMPGLNGERLAALLAARRPGLPVLFVSGFAPDTVLLERLRLPRSSFLAKPFARSELAAAIRHALDAA